MRTCTTLHCLPSIFSGISFDSHGSPGRQATILSHFTDEETDLRSGTLLKFLPRVGEGLKTRDQSLLTTGPGLFPYPAAPQMAFPIGVSRLGCLYNKQL